MCKAVAAVLCQQEYAGQRSPLVSAVFLYQKDRSCKILVPSPRKQTQTEDAETGQNLVTCLQFVHSVGQKAALPQMAI